MILLKVVADSISFHRELHPNALPRGGFFNVATHYLKTVHRQRQPRQRYKLQHQNNLYALQIE